MTTTNPVITRAVVELTFANGVTRRLVVDDKDPGVPVAFQVSVDTDARETTPDHARWRTFAAGERQTVDVHLVGRGPRQIDIPDPRGAINELRAELTVHQQRRHLIEQELSYVAGDAWSKDAIDVARTIRETLALKGCTTCPPGCRFCIADPECECYEHQDDVPAVPAVPSETPGANHE